MNIVIYVNEKVFSITFQPQRHQIMVIKDYTDNSFLSVSKCPFRCTFLTFIYFLYFEIFCDFIMSYVHNVIRKGDIAVS